jgi:hypothetical protein
MGPTKKKNTLPAHHNKGGLRKFTSQTATVRKFAELFGDNKDNPTYHSPDNNPEIKTRSFIKHTHSANKNKDKKNPYISGMKSAKHTNPIAKTKTSQDVIKATAVKTSAANKGLVGKFKLKAKIK